MRRLYDLLPGFFVGLCVLACGVAGNGLYYSVSEFRQGIPAGIVVTRLAFLGLLFAFACILYRLRSRQYGALPLLWVEIFLAAVLAGAAGNSWQAWLESLAVRRPIAFPVAPAVYSLFFFAVLARVRHTFRKIPPRSLIDIAAEDPERRPHLVLFLSEISDLQGFPSGVPLWLTGNSRNLDEDLARLAEEKSAATRAGRRVGFWPWEQLLRAIAHHLQKDTLKAVTVIASEESIRQVPLFAGLVLAYPVLKRINFRLFLKTADRRSRLVAFDDCPSTGGWRFEDFTELSKAVHSLLALLNESGFHDREMMIDFTGGKKVTSVVAAAMTFNRPVKAQYVETEEPWSVLSYSVVTAPEMGPGT